MTYVIKTDYANAIYTPYGGAEELMYCHDHEVIIQGPAETGKTLAACWKAHIIASKYPKAQGAIVRKTQKAVYGSVLQTFERVIEGAPVMPYGGEKPEKYIYANGSVIWVGGMDNPDKILSSERDFIYVNQTEELTQDDWEKLVTRATGRAAVVPYPQVFGDCNPSGSQHWIRKRGEIKLIRSQHKDNPTLVDQATGKLTPQGERTMGILSGLTGVRRKRLFEGIWATAEGAVYDTFDAAVHVRERERTEMVAFLMMMDEGYTNPAVILDVGIDSDGRLHIFREFYKRGVLQKDVVKTAAEWNLEVGEIIDILKGVDPKVQGGYKLYHPSGHYLIAVDAAAAGLIADLRDIGLPAQGYKGRVLDGITAVQGYLSIQKDGNPRLTIDPACVETINEFESYTWKPEKDEPIKENDHAMDALRYGVNALGGANWTVY